LLDKTKAEEAMLDLEKEKSSWTSDKGDFEKKIGDLGGDLAKANETKRRMARWRCLAIAKAVLRRPNLRWRFCTLSWTCRRWIL